jgi:macrodomain Ter protein organizer (MatP/YcbG family)
MSKIRMNISVSRDTKQRLQEYAKENHTTVSQVITNLIWNTNLKNTYVADQMVFDLDRIRAIAGRPPLSR